MDKRMLQDYAAITSTIAVMQQAIRQIEDVYETSVCDYDDNDIFSSKIFDEALPHLQYVVDQLKEARKLWYTVEP